MSESADYYEGGYDPRQVVVAAHGRKLSATAYVARRDTIDPSLKPFSWYHRFVVQGAKEHELPVDYIRYLEAFESVADPDVRRHEHNWRLIRRDWP